MGDGVAKLLHTPFSRFDHDAFYVEMARVLRPQGTLAAWMYDIPHFGVPDADQALAQWYKGVLGPYWSERRVHVDNHYRGVCVCVTTTTSTCHKLPQV